MDILLTPMHTHTYNHIYQAQTYRNLIHRPWFVAPLLDVDTPLTAMLLLASPTRALLLVSAKAEASRTDYENTFLQWCLGQFHAGQELFQEASTCHVVDRQQFAAAPCCLAVQMLTEERDDKSPG